MKNHLQHEILYRLTVNGPQTSAELIQMLKPKHTPNFYRTLRVLEERKLIIKEGKDTKWVALKQVHEAIPSIKIDSQPVDIFPVCPEDHSDNELINFFSVCNLRADDETLDRVTTIFLEPRRKEIEERFLEAALLYMTLNKRRYFHADRVLKHHSQWDEEKQELLDERYPIKP